MKPTSRYVSKPVSDNARDVEAWALAEASRRLIDASHSPDDSEALQGALLLNQRLWTIFQAAISEPDCPMPPDMRSNVAALSLMVDRETIARLVDLDVKKLDTLININRNVASGLSQQIDDVSQAAAPQTAAAPVPNAMRPSAYPPAGGQRPTAPETTPGPLRISI